MHGNSITTLIKSARARTRDHVILAALSVLEDLAHRIASHQISVSCKACAAKYRGNKTRATEFRLRAKRKPKGAAKAKA
jgi:hypothetical protein